MDEKIEMLHKLCKALMKELEDYSKKIEKSDGMSAGDLEAVDKLSHALKSVKTAIAMIEAGGEEGYSARYMPYWTGGMSYAEGGRGRMGGNSNRGGSSNRGGNSYEGGSSYARGGRGGRNNNPSGRNQYSREGGYSYADEVDGIIDELEGMMDTMPADKQRRVQQLMDELRR